MRRETGEVGARAGHRWLKTEFAIFMLQLIALQLVFFSAPLGRRGRVRGGGAVDLSRPRPAIWGRHAEQALDGVEGRRPQGRLDRDRRERTMRHWVVPVIEETPKLRQDVAAPVMLPHARHRAT